MLQFYNLNPMYGIRGYLFGDNPLVLFEQKMFCFISTVHKDITDRLTQVNPQLAQEARKVLEVNKAERHIRGGMATKKKYQTQTDKLHG